jgi:hypothetical protein
VPDASGRFRGISVSAEAWERIFGGHTLSPDIARVIEAAVATHRDIVQGGATVQLTGEQLDAIRDLHEQP